MHNAHHLSIYTPRRPMRLHRTASAQGTGGMITKLQAAKICMQCGCAMVIASGSDPENLYAILDGEGKGTLFGEVRS